jgi:hypothetical protein
MKSFPRHLLTRPASERLAYFRSYTVAHPRLQEVDAILQRVIAEPVGSSLIFVYGPTGVGKTTLRLRIEQRLKEEFLASAESDEGRLPVVSVEAIAPDYGSFNWRDYYTRALLALVDPLVERKINEGVWVTYRNSLGHYVGQTVNNELRHRMEQALRHRRPSAMLIDEAQHFTKMGSGKKLIDQLDCLKSLASQTGCVHVLIGTYELLPCRNLSAQLSRRSLDIHFPRYRADHPPDVTAFQRVVFSFQRHLPLEQEPELWSDWEYLYTHSIGCIGVLKDWFVRALNEALSEGAPTLTRKHLEQHAWSLDQCEKMMQEAMEGEMELTEKPEARTRLRRMMGLSEPQTNLQGESSKESPSPSTAKGVSVGRRNPVRDKVGK